MSHTKDSCAQSKIVHELVRILYIADDELLLGDLLEGFKALESIDLIEPDSYRIKEAIQRKKIEFESRRGALGSGMESIISRLNSISDSI